MAANSIHLKWTHYEEILIDFALSVDELENNPLSKINISAYLYKLMTIISAHNMV